MKNLHKLLIICCLLTITSALNLISGQVDIGPFLLTDIVKEDGDDFFIEEYGTLYTFDKEYRIRINATASKKLISKDNFIRYYGALSGSVFVTFLNQEGIKPPDDMLFLKEVKPPDKTDIAVTITMNEKGIYYKTETSNSKSQMEIQWSQVIQEKF